MGLIKAIAGSIGGTLHDAWLDAIKCDNMNNETLSVKVTSPNGNPSVLSKGSRIIVNVGQAALLVDNGAIVDACAEPGAYTFDKSSSATMMYGGDFGGMFREMWERFKYGGGIAKEQAVYFVNLKEIIDNKFGTPTPIPFSDWGHPTVNPRTSSFYGMSVKIRVFGKYTFKVANPFQFVSEIAGTEVRFTKENLTEQISSELLSSFRNTLAELGSDAYKTPALDLPHKDDEIITLMKEKHYDDAITARGVAIHSISVEGLTFDEESQGKINQYELSDEYSKSAYLAQAQGEALKSAAANTAGAGNTLIGLGLGFGAAGINPMQQLQKNVQGQQNANEALADHFVEKATEANDKNKTTATWNCTCGKENSGKFCSDCGKAKPISDEWLCSCGNKASGKFCSECGAQKPDHSVWNCACGEKEITGKFCSKCGAKKPE